MAMTTSTEETPQINFDDICTAKTLAFENQKILTEQQVNWLLKTRNKNGLASAGAVLKISNKLYIHKTKFFEWFMTQKAA